MNWPPALNAAADHGLIGDVITTISPHTESDKAALVIQILTAFGNAIGRNHYFQVEADKHYGNIYCVLVGRTAKGRKGTSWGRVERLFSLADDRSLWVTECIRSGLSSGEGLIWQVRDSVDDDDPGVSDKRLLVFEPEFASVLKHISRRGNTLSATVRSAWDGRQLSSMTKHSPARATGAHISVIGHVTRDELIRNLTATETASGFANRFLFVCTQRSKTLPHGGDLSDDDLAPLAIRLARAVDYGRIKGPDRMRFSDRSARLWEAVYPDLSEGATGLFGHATSRAEAQALRLSMLYALLDESDGIEEPHLEAGLEVWRYCEDSARYVFGDSLGDPIADSILEALKARRDEGMTRTEIRDYFQRNKSAMEINRALAVLKSCNRITAKMVDTGGRQAEVWKAV